MLWPCASAQKKNPPHKSDFRPFYRPISILTHHAGPNSAFLRTLPSEPWGKNCKRAYCGHAPVHKKNKPFLKWFSTVLSYNDEYTASPSAPRSPRQIFCAFLGTFPPEPWGKNCQAAYCGHAPVHKNTPPPPYKSDLRWFLRYDENTTSLSGARSPCKFFVRSLGPSRRPMRKNCKLAYCGHAHKKNPTLIKVISDRFFEQWQIQLHHLEGAAPANFLCFPWDPSPRPLWKNSKPAYCGHAPVHKKANPHKSDFLPFFRTTTKIQLDPLDHAAPVDFLCVPWDPSRRPMRKNCKPAYCDHAPVHKKKTNPF